MGKRRSRATARGQGGTPARALLAGGISRHGAASSNARDMSADEIAEAVVRGSSDPSEGPALSPTVEEMLEDLQEHWTVSVHSLGKRHWNIRLRSAIVNAPIVKHELDLDASSLREAVARAYAFATEAG